MFTKIFNWIKSLFGIQPVSDSKVYNWQPDLPDVRDHIFIPSSTIVAKLPTSVDLRSKCSPVEDQGQLGSCTGNALAGALEFLEGVDGVPFKDVSRLFIYYNERALEGTIGTDSGAYIRDGIKALAVNGACTEKLWPYKISKFATKPTKACYTDGAKRTITSYQRITDLNSMKSCLAAGYPFVFGFTVYDGFESAQTAQTGVLNMPAKGEAVLGGHAVLCVGYDDATQRVIVRNSWGPNWGQKGYFTMPYAYISNKGLADDMWTIRKGTGI